jgi:hypothetical protein
MKRGRRFLPTQREKLLELVTTLSQKHRYPSTIAAKLGEIDPQFAGLALNTILYYRKLAEKRWEKSAVEKIDKIKTLELQQLYLLREEAWNAYQRSIGKSRVVVKEGKAGDKDGQLKGQKVTIREEDLVGDSSWVARLLEIHRRICELVGADQPLKLELAGKDGGPIETKNEHSISYHEYAKAFCALAGGRGKNGLEDPAGDSPGEPLDPARSEGGGLPIDPAVTIPDTSGK